MQYFYALNAYPIERIIAVGSDLRDISDTAYVLMSKINTSVIRLDWPMDMRSCHYYSLTMPNRVGQAGAYPIFNNKKFFRNDFIKRDSMEYPKPVEKEDIILFKRYFAAVSAINKTDVRFPKGAPFHFDGLESPEHLWEPFEESVDRERLLQELFESDDPREVIMKEKSIYLRSRYNFDEKEILVSTLFSS